MTIEVSTPDGTVVEFPEGTDEATIKRVMKSQAGEQKQPGSRPPIPAPGGAGPQAGARAATPQEQLKAGARGAFVAGGATAGVALGAAAGPPGMLAGGAMGAAAGSLVFDNVNDALRHFGIEELPGGTELQETPEQNLMARSRTAAGEAALEAGFTAGSALLFPVKRVLSPLLGKIFGVRGEGAKRMRSLAASQGIELSAVDIGGKPAKGFARALGIFPFTGAPLRRGRDLKEMQLTKRVNEILNEVAPTSTLAGEAGMDLMKAAQGSDRRFRSASAALYNRFREAAREINVPIIPTDETKGAIAKFAEEFRLGQIPLEGDEVQVLKGGLPEAFEQFLQDAQKLPSHLTYDQHTRLLNQFKGFVDQVSPDGYTVKRVAQIKSAMEADLNAIGEGIKEVSSDAIAAVKKLKEDADTFFSGGIGIFQTSTAAKFGRVDKRIFRAGPEKAGSIDADELLTPVFNVKSPQALRDLRALVGDEPFRKAARAHLDDVVANSFKSEMRGGETVEIFDLDLFQGKLGLVRGSKDRSAALEEILKGTGVKVQDLRDLVENARIMKISDPSTFIARRMTLGGTAAVGAVLGAGGGMIGSGAGGVLLPVIMTVLARSGSKVLADPKALKALTRSFSPDVTDLERRAFQVRFMRLMGENFNAAPQVEPQRDFPVGSPP